VVVLLLQQRASFLGLAKLQNLQKPLRQQQHQI
jgi:hypothetical protein